jgi:hypothetical protein
MDCNALVEASFQREPNREDSGKPADGARYIDVVEEVFPPVALHVDAERFTPCPLLQCPAKGG